MPRGPWMPRRSGHLVVRGDEVLWAPHVGMPLGGGDRPPLTPLTATRTGLSHILVARAPVVPLTSANAP